MQRPIVFISHIKEEYAIAAALKALVESGFLGMMDVFISSDPTSINLGRKWLDRVSDSLKRCAVEIIIAGPASVKRPWINFEAGAGWIRDIPVIPLCHSGMTPDKLPLPLGTLQAATATDETQLLAILPVLAEALGSGLPSIEFTSFIAAVREFENVSRESAAIVARTPIALTDGLAAHELATFVTIAEQTGPNTTNPVSVIREGMEEAGYRGIAVSLALKTLERKDLIELVEETPDSGFGYPYYAARISDEGWAWLEENKHMLELKIAPPTQSTAASTANTFAAEDGDDIPF